MAVDNNLGFMSTNGVYTQNNNVDNVAKYAETSGKKAAKNIANAWEKAGEEAGTKIANHIGEQLKRVANDFLHTMGKLDIVGSFSKGLDMAKNFRQEYGKYAIGASSLKDLSNTITGAFKMMQQNGVIVDPQEIYNSLGTVKQMVSLAGTQVDKLTEISATVSMIAKTGISINTTNQSSNYLRQQFGTEVLADINARLNLVSTQFQNYTEDLANTIYNSPILQQIETHLRKSTAYQLETQANQQTMMLTTIENLNQTVGVIADNFNKDAATNIYEMFQKSISGQMGFGDMYGSVIGQYINKYLPYDTWSERGKAYYTENPEQYFMAVIKGIKDLGNQGWVNATTWNNISAMSGNTGITWETFQAIVNDTSDIAEIAKQMYTKTSVDFAKKDDNNVYAKVTEATMTAIDKLNARSTLAGYQAGTLTYQDTVVQQLSMIVQLMQNVFGEGTLGQIAKSLGGSLVQGVTTGTMNALVSQGLNANTSSGNNMGGKIAAIIAAVTATVAIGTAAVEAYKAHNEELSERMGSGIDSLYEINKDTKFIPKIQEDTNSLAGNDGDNDNISSGAAFIVPVGVIDTAGNLTIKEYKSFTAEQAAEAEAAQKEFYDAINTSQQRTVDNIKDTAGFKWATAIGAATGIPAGGFIGQAVYKGMKQSDLDKTAGHANLLGDNSDYLNLYLFYNSILGQEGIDDLKFYDNRNAIARNLYSDPPQMLYNGQWWTLAQLKSLESIQGTSKVDTLNSIIENGVDSISNLPKSMPEFEKGIDNVPEDGYLARLHAGEMVIPAKRANYLRKLWGQPTKRESKVQANILTGDNGLVQSIPEFASGTDGNPYLLYEKASADEQGRVDPELEKLLLAFTMAMGQPSLRISWGMRRMNTSRGAKKSMHKLGLAADVQGWAKHNVPRGTENKYGLARNAKDTDGSWEYWHYTPSWATSFDALRNQGYPRIGYTEVPDGTKIYASDIGGVTPIANDIATQIDNATQISSATQSAEGKSSGGNIIQSLVAKYGMNWLTNKFGGAVSGSTATGDGTGGAATTGDSPGGTLIGALATIRQQLRNAATDSDILAFFNRTRREVGGQGDQAIQAFMETIFNRAASRGRSIYQTVTGAYYGKNNDGGLTNALSAEMSERYNNILNTVLGGSNITKFATGNASGNVGFGYGNGKNDPYTLMVNGERFGIEKGIDVKWSDSMKQQLNMLAEGGIVKSTPGGVPAIIGEGKNDEAVIPLNNQEDYLGLQEATVTIIDVLDEFCNVVCKRLDDIMNMQKQYIGLDTSITQKQVSTRLENLKQFNYNY